jgi:hypothetical protein
LIKPPAATFFRSSKNYILVLGGAYQVAMLVQAGVLLEQLLYDPPIEYDYCSERLKVFRSSRFSCQHFDGQRHEPDTFESDRDYGRERRLPVAAGHRVWLQPGCQ